MKKIWILFILTVTLTMCGRVNVSVDAPTASASIENLGNMVTDVSSSIEKHNGMEYLIVLAEIDGRGGVDIEVTNLTKDKLECDLLKKKLK